MKRIVLFLVMFIMTLFILTPVVQAQEWQNPNDYPGYYLISPFAAQEYSRSFADTSIAYNLGGAAFSSITIYHTDTMKADFYLDYKLRGDTTWTQGYADSIISTSAARQEIVFRKPGTDRIGGLDRQVRYRLSQRTTSNYDTSATHTDVINWKP